MTRALAVLTLLALLTVAVESTDDPHPLLAVALGTTYAAHALVALPWLSRQPVPRRYWLTAAHVCLQLPLGVLLFGAAHAGVGATLLLLVLVAQCVLLLPLPGAALVTLLVPLVHLGMGWADFARNAVGLLGAAVFTAVVTALLEEAQRARAELAEANEQLRGHAAQAAELATTRERNRLARDIHDGLGHHLTVVQMQVQAARAVLPTDPGRADAVLAKAQQQASEALAEVRRSVAALREHPAAPPLRAALETLTEESAAAGVPATLEVHGTERELPAETSESLFRSAQEGLTNVRKHACATSARVVLTYGGDGTVRLAVRDDGRGLPAAAGAGDAPTFGLLGLRERAARVGGRVTVGSSGSGTELLVEVPG
ncbi:Signal transduction histidine kinase [Geodermatophilus telluris]|uniref:histidine kinase n=1 Tax=Geodermatophilus telluris TaxID=1190417 RepID=A0A1G6I019_9ACTN|nr:sensor histidine kinase [Geodermatophilus telluris]SDB99897.1 Signal transduction histidine kinase [Geodermatophilus telluris]